MRFRTIVADPPWPFTWNGGAGGRRRRSTPLGYELMEYADIAALPIGELAADDATLLLWVTQDALHSGQARRVVIDWGFPVRCAEWIWHKPNFGMGAYPRPGHEVCVVYRRGAGSLRADSPRDVHSVQVWSQHRGKGNGGKVHSAKPDAFYDAVERGHEGPFLEVFARRARFGWEYAGDGSHGTVEIPGLRVPDGKVVVA